MAIEAAEGRREGDEDGDASARPPPAAGPQGARGRLIQAIQVFGAFKGVRTAAGSQRVDALKPGSVRVRSSLDTASPSGSLRQSADSARSEPRRESRGEAAEAAAPPAAAAAELGPRAAPAIGPVEEDEEEGGDWGARAAAADGRRAAEAEAALAAGESARDAQAAGAAGP